MSEPNTKAGRTLLQVFDLWSNRQDLHEEMRDAILAIEREAAAPQSFETFTDGDGEVGVRAAAPQPLDGERLYRAWWQAAWQAKSNPPQWEQLAKDARDVWGDAAARLSRKEPSDE